MTSRKKRVIEEYSAVDQVVGNSVVRGVEKRSAVPRVSVATARHSAIKNVSRSGNSHRQTRQRKGTHSEKHTCSGGSRQPSDSEGIRAKRSAVGEWCHPPCHSVPQESGKQRFYGWCWNAAELAPPFRNAPARLMSGTRLIPGSTEV